MTFEDILTRHTLPFSGAYSPEELIKVREEIREKIQKTEYGILPSRPEHLSSTVTSDDDRYAGGKARRTEIEIKLYNGTRTFAFSLTAIYPKKAERIPAIIYIDGEGTIPNKYLPSEEIADNGFALFSFYCEDITPDNPDFKGKLPKFLEINRRLSTAPGKLMLWAYAAMRVMDYVEALDFIDKENTSVVGHARLGIAALLTAALDERFGCAISSSAPSRVIRGGRGIDVLNGSAHLFCPKYIKTLAKQGGTESDGVHLLSLIPPRRLVIGNAENDLTVNLENEFSRLRSVSEIYNLYGLCGLIHEGGTPKAPALLDEGNLCYYLREGESYLTRQDWHTYMNYIKKNTENKNDL